MKVMQSHDWFDEYVIDFICDSVTGGDSLGTRDIRLLRFKLLAKSILITKEDVVALAKEFNLVVYERNANL